MKNVSLAFLLAVTSLTAVEQKKQTAQQIAQTREQVAAEGRRTRIDLGVSVAGVQDKVEQMNEEINEGITGLRNDIRNNTAGLANSLTELYTNVGRNATLLGGLQEGQAQIRATLQTIEQAINDLDTIGMKSAELILELDTRVNNINDKVMTIGLTPETLDELQIAIAEIDDEMRRGFKEDRGRVGVSLEQQQKNEYELIQRLRLVAKPLDVVTGYVKVKDLTTNV
jgi:uncharacterized phage infection (PIP) family protein YhgE